MFKKVALGLLTVGVVLLVVVATRPATYQVTRSTVVAAPPADAFAQVNDFHQWGSWSPWEKLDAATKKTYEGPTAGVGASYFWSGNKQVGEGRMTILESRPGERIVIKLEFIKPFAALSTTTFSFVPQGGATQVTWTMDGTNNFLAKGMSLFMNMDTMVGKSFEEGLAQLKVLAETSAQQRAAALAAAALAVPPVAPVAVPAVAPVPIPADAPTVAAAPNTAPTVQ